MAAPFVLGGVTVPLHAGSPNVEYAQVGGYTDVRLGQGKLVRERHFSKWAITISGSGWMATGLSVLNWDAEHELLSPKPMRVDTETTEVTIITDARPDVPVAAHALVGRDWVPTPVVMDGRDATITPVSGALKYSVAWYPVFTVLCIPPGENNADGAVSWQIVANEV
tara:strand:- start:44 stop:544 length:501 start_codon:yes stop_codon:yes gene_type:complete